MSVTINTPKIREVINQVVNDPDYKQVSKVPLISVHQIGLIVLAYTGFIGGIYLYLTFQVSLWIIYPIMVLSSYMAFTPLHDATHRAVSSNKFLNDLLGSISGFILFPFITTPTYRFLHMSHHRYVGDDDLDPDSILVSIPTRYFPFGFLILPFFDVVWIYWAFTKGRYRLSKPVLRWFVFTSIGFLVFYVYGLSNFWYEFLILFIIPTRLGIAYTAYHFATIQHPEGVKWDELPFESTYLIKGREKNLFVRSLLGQGYHAMHHFLPHVPWYKYRKVWDLGNNIFSKQAIPERSVYGKLERNAREKFLKAKENEISHLNVKIARIEELTKNIKTYHFEPTEAEVLPEFSAGSHIDLHLPSGIKRSYSLVNPPYERHQYQIAVKKEESGKGGSKELHEKIGIGDVLKISIPKNNFVLYEKPKRFILIAGGIGITPLISMAHRLEELDKHFEFHICAKDEKEIPFTYELKNWPFAPMVEFHIDKDGRSTIDLSALLSKPNAETLIYVCGPKAFNKWVLSSAKELGWEDHQLKQELFSADDAAFTPPKEFQVVLRKSNKTITVPKNLSIIDAVEMHDVSIDYSCLQGTCGTCITNVVEGEIDHRDAVLSEEEKIAGNKICLCVSRAKGDKLILDL